MSIEYTLKEWDKFRFEKVNEDAVIPQYQTAGSAGMDLHSVESTTLAPGERRLVKTGLVLHGVPGYEAQVRPRSGLALKHGITVLNSPGTVDSDYKGEIGIILYNTSFEIFYVQKGDRIAQLVIAPVAIAREFLSDNSRSTDGFGSTGV